MKIKHLLSLLFLLAATSLLKAQPYTLPVPGGAGSSSPPTPSANTLIVSPVGTDPIASGIALTNVLAGAIPGTTIHVLPGLYEAHNLLKRGVNWYFDPGATVQWDQGAHLKDTNLWIGIFDDRPTGSVTNVIVGGYGDFIWLGPGSTNHIDATGTNSVPFEMFNTVVDVRLFATNPAAASSWALSRTKGAVVLTNLSTFSMSANSISTHLWWFQTGNTNDGTSIPPSGSFFGNAWAVYVQNCTNSTFNIREVKSWSPGTTNGDIYGFTVIENDGVSGYQTNYFSSNPQAAPLGSFVFSGAPLGDQSAAFYWAGGDEHVNCEHLWPMAGPGNNGVWADVGSGLGSSYLGASVNWWINIKDCETYLYDSSSDPNARVWFDFQQYHDIHEGFGGITLEGSDKVYIRGEKMMFPTNIGYAIVSAPTQASGTNIGEVWLTLQKLAFDTTAFPGTPAASGWISVVSGGPKIYADIQTLEDTGNNIGHGSGVGIVYNSTNGLYLRGQFAALGSGPAQFLSMQGGTNCVIEGLTVDGRNSSITNAVSLYPGATNLTLKNMNFLVNPSTTTNLIGASAANTWVKLESVYANQTNGLNVLVTNGGSATMHWP